MDGLVYSSILGWVLGIAFGVFAGFGLYKEIMWNYRSNEQIAKIIASLVGLVFFSFGFILGQIPDFRGKIELEKNKNLSYLEEKGYEHWENLHLRPIPMRRVNSCETDFVFTDDRFNSLGKNIDDERVAAVFCMKKRESDSS